MLLQIDPVIFSIGGFPILRWYSLAYIVGFVIGGFFVKRYNKKYHIFKTKEILDSAATYAVAGVIAGGRIGYIVFYNLEFYISHPSEIFMIWHGGMSFHGGLLGVVISMILFTNKHKIPKLLLGDVFVIAATPGLLFGRIANFINGELWGKHTESAIGFIFPQSGDLLPRHPSQLYESLSEGLILFCILFTLERAKHKNGTVFASFFIGYGIFRFIIEFFREPDTQVGYLMGSWLTMGHILCSAMVLFGSFLLYKINTNAYEK